ncbi:ribonuclease HII [Archaeoglobales archaeon]|nr:MAG: ribonuclease HII [Archaeoglobales archaeon]
MRIAGIDEAGKGPVIGPLVVSIFCCDNDGLERLKKIGVRDSKRLNAKKREELAEKIKKIGEVGVLKIQAEELDELMKNKTINEVLKECYSKLIRRVDADLYILDSPDVIPGRIANELKSLTNKKINAYHKADENYEVVAAASVVAKVERDAEIENIKKIVGDFGSGYASDSRTINFLKEYIKKHGKLPPHTRKRWKTAFNLMQKSLDEFY